MLGPLRGGSLDRRKNALIATATANVSRHRLIDLVVAGLALLGDERGGVHDLAGLAISALRHVLGAPGFLHRVVAVGRKTLDGGDRVPGNILHGDDARTDGLAIEMDRTRPAEARTTAELRARERELVPQ